MNRPSPKPSLPSLSKLQGYLFDAEKRIWARPGSNEFAYSDGDEVERRIGAAIEGSADVSLFSSELRKHQTDWPSTYHLSPVRANLLRPVARLFKGARILEVGAGCGAITRFLGEQGAQVLALEGSARRAAMAASRCRDLDQVSVVCDPFEAFETVQRFDVVTLIGVLEYARIYSKGSDPIGETLRKAHSLLADDGVLLVAIENQLGLKYFAGMHEDHLGRAMAGIEDQYTPDGVVTFGKVELERRLKEAGFSTTEVALPFPDYKLPQCVVLPAGYAADSSLSAGSLAGQSVRSDRQIAHPPLFSMGPAFAVLERNGLLSDLSNSFLVFAGKSASSRTLAQTAPNILAEHYSADRRAAFAKVTRFIRDDERVRVERGRLCPQAHYSSKLLVALEAGDEPYFKGENWADRLDAILSKPQWTLEDVTSWFATWRDALCETAFPGQPASASLLLDTVVPGHLIDALPRNLVLTNGAPRFFDLEWSLTAPVSFGYMAYRAIGVSLATVSGVAQPQDARLLHVPSLIKAVLRQFGLLLTGSHLQQYFDFDATLHDEATGEISKPLDLSVFDGYLLNPKPDIGRLARGLDSNSEALAHHLSQQAQELVAKQQHIAQLENAVHGAKTTLAEQLAAEQQHVAQLERAVHATETELHQAKAIIANNTQHISLLEVRVENALLQEESTRRRAQEAEYKLAEATAQLAVQQSAIADGVSREVQLQSALQDRDNDLLQLGAEIAGKDGEIHRLWHSKSVLKARVEDLTLRNETLHKDLLEVNQNREMAMHHQRELELLKNSWSWSITAPIRAINRVRRDLTSSIRNCLALSVEKGYRRLPLSQSRKQALKGAFFKATSSLIRGTRAYQRWEAYERMRGLLPTQAIAEQLYTPVFRASETPQTQELMLGQADGVSEWAEYQPLRDRIRAKGSELRDKDLPKQRPMLDFAGKEPYKVAAGIKLPAPVESPDVTILIPVYNHLTTTLECLASIASASEEGLSFEILVADDASTDESSAVLGTIAGVRLVSQPKNLGFLRNCNTAARYAHGRNLLLLNNDVQVTKGWLSAMVSCLESDEEVGAVGPKIVYPNGRLQEAGATLHSDGTAEMVGLNERPDLPGYSFSREVDYCSGACLLIRMSDFAALGGFDDRYAPAYCEDSDLCMRLRERGKRIMFCANAEVIHHLSKTSNGLDNDYKLACISRNLQTFTSTWQHQLDEMDRVRTIAFYLPQFHPIAQNDLWWGRGFTEWTNVTKARPNFIGHYQPRVPADLGYYDLRVADVMRHQAELAKRYGVSGFCYYYYWFAGQRLLEAPIERMLESNDPDMPFCLCWANENWTRRWDGQEQEVLMSQHHSREDDLAVIHDLMRYFASPNYIRVNGRPLLLVYRVALFPDFAETARLWREMCIKEGIGEIYLVQVESFELNAAGIKPAHFGCDAAVEFPPHGMAETYPLQAPLLNPEYQGAVADYRDLAVRYATRPFPDYKRFASVMPGWDNTARRQNHSYVFEHSTPGAFQAWLETTVARTKQQYCGEERLIFINAWNEWAEGAYLEPDRRFGHAYLEALRNALDASQLMRHGSYSLGD